MIAATPPHPDSAPQAHGRRPVMVAYDIVLPAVRQYAPGKGDVIPHWFFRCHVPVNGHRHCVIFHR